MDVDSDYLHPQGYLDIVTGVAPATKGRHIANLADAPTVTESDERTNPFEDLYGKTTTMVGEDQVQSSMTEISASITVQTLKNLKLLRPDLSFSHVFGADGAFATLSIGTGTAGVTYTADARGTGGNSIRVAQVNPGAASPLSVAVSGNDITVTLAHNGTALTSTAAQVRDAVNAHTAAAALVNAGLTGDGTGVAVAQALTNLSGGTLGTVVGVRAKRTLNLTSASYSKNIVLAYSTSELTIGGAWILRNALNVNDEREYSFNDDMAVFGVDATFRAHSNGSSMDAATGVILPDVEEHSYRETVIPAGL